MQEAGIRRSQTSIVFAQQTDLCSSLGPRGLLLHLGRTEWETEGRGAGRGQRASLSRTEAQASPLPGSLLAGPPLLSASVQDAPRLGDSGDVSHFRVSCPCLSPQTRLQAGVGYGNTLSCIRMVYRKESVSAPRAGCWSSTHRGLPQHGAKPTQARRAGGQVVPHHTWLSFPAHPAPCPRQHVLPEPLVQCCWRKKQVLCNLSAEILRNLEPQWKTTAKKQGDLSGFSKPSEWPGPHAHRRPFIPAQPGPGTPTSRAHSQLVPQVAGDRGTQGFSLQRRNLSDIL